MASREGWTSVSSVFLFTTRGYLANATRMAQVPAEARHYDRWFGPLICFAISDKPPTQITSDLIHRIKTPSEESA